mgnify:CR=1 FL=1
MTKPNQKQLSTGDTFPRCEERRRQERDLLVKDLAFLIVQEHRRRQLASADKQGSALGQATAATAPAVVNDDLERTEQ